MYCINCGNKINSNDKYCTRCGNKLDIVNSKNNVINKGYSGKKIASIILGTISIVLSFMIIFVPISMILSIIGLVFSLLVIKRENNILGILLNLIGLVISLGICIIFIFVIRFAHDGVNKKSISDYNNGLGKYDYYSERF